MDERTREGYLFGIGAYGLWGLVPLYFKLLTGEVQPLEILSHRVVWTVLFLALLVTIIRRWSYVVDAIRSPHVVGLLFLSSWLIAINWYVYIYSVDINEIKQASLGYYITPLVSVLLGLLILGEQLRPLQWYALALATIGVLMRVILLGQFPTIAIALALSFSFYSLIRKKTPVDALTGLIIESTFLMPVAVGMWLWWKIDGTLAFGEKSRSLDTLIIASGVVTALPLLCFGQAARRLPLSALGFLQYLSPTIQLLLAIFFFGESVDLLGWFSFSIIWWALILFSVDSIRQVRDRPKS